jgi:hypothetical protein
MIFTPGFGEGSRVRPISRPVRRASNGGIYEKPVTSFAGIALYE